MPGNHALMFGTDDITLHISSSFSETIKACLLASDRTRNWDVTPAAQDRKHQLAPPHPNSHQNPSRGGPMQIHREVAGAEGQVKHNSDPIQPHSVCPVDSGNAAVAARLRANDAGIVEELICRYHERLRRYLIRLTEDREFAEDILQETWIRVVTRGSQFKGDSQFSTWLFAVARNLVRDQRRKKRIQTRSFDVITGEREEIPLELASADSTPFEHIANLERKRALRDALRALMPHHREVLELRFLHELSPSEISRIIGEPVSTVKARLYRALTTLRPRIEGKTLPGAATLMLAL
jgi:RNA polymerase sigma-70 factor, ECF subfamily